MSTIITLILIFAFFVFCNRGYEDETEVNWAALDREFNFYQTSSRTYQFLNVFLHFFIFSALLALHVNISFLIPKYPVHILHNTHLGFIICHNRAALERAGQDVPCE